MTHLEGKKIVYCVTLLSVGLSRTVFFSYACGEMEEEIVSNRWKDLAGDQLYVQRLVSSSPRSYSTAVVSFMWQEVFFHASQSSVNL